MLVNTGCTNDTWGELIALWTVFRRRPAPDPVALPAGAAGDQLSVRVERQAQRAALAGRPEHGACRLVGLPDGRAGKIEAVAKAGRGDSGFGANGRDEVRAG